MPFAKNTLICFRTSHHSPSEIDISNSVSKSNKILAQRSQRNLSYNDLSSQTKACEVQTPSPTPARKLLRSEEHTSELQSRSDLVCRLLLEKKKTRNIDLVPKVDPHA